MTATKKLAETNHVPGWALLVNGQPIAGDWEVVSPFGSVGTAVVIGPNGQPQFDRPYYREAPYGQTPVWGRGADGMVRLGLIVQARPHSDAPGPENFNRPNSPVLFMTCPMGFLNIVRGKLETALQGARREATEEIGSALVLSEWKHLYGINAAPSFNTTWGEICALEVDLKSVIPAAYDSSEPIAGHYWLTVAEFMAVVAVGTFLLPSGEVAYAAFGTANAAIFAFLCAHPHIMAEGCVR